MKRSWGWDERFLAPDGHFSWERELANPPGRSELLDYLGRLRSHIRQWVPENDDTVYLSPTQERLRGECLLDEMLYVLRHSQQHLGEIEIEYLIRELPTPEWKW